MKKRMLLTILCSIFITKTELLTASHEESHSATKQKRNQEDATRTQQWQKEDEEKAAARNSESFLTRILHKVTSDQTEDLGIQKERNKQILEINRQRLHEDFAEQKQKFETFKRDYSKFSNKEPFQTLLKLGDMNTFVSMTYEKRKEFIDELRSTTNPDNLKKYTMSENDREALTQLMEIAMPDRSLQVTDAIADDVRANPNLHNVAQQLNATLSKSIQEAINKLDDFNESTENLTSDIAKLERIRIIKKIGLYAMFAIGATACIFMLAHAAIVIGPVVLGVELFAVLTKTSMYIYHTRTAQEAALAVELQQNFTEQFKKLLPNTTQLIDATRYANQAKTFAQRIGDMIDNKIESSLSQKHPNTLRVYQSGKAVVQSVTSTISQVSQITSRYANNFKEFLFKPSPQEAAKARKIVTKQQKSEFSLAPSPAATVPTA